MEQQSAPRFMTVTEVADIMRVSKMTVYRLIHSGEMPAIRVGKELPSPGGRGRPDDSGRYGRSLW